MKSAIAIAVDGVIRNHVGLAPIPEGLRLYRTLAEVFNVILLADEHDPEYAAQLEHFFHTEQMDRHSRCVYADPNAVDLRDARCVQATRLRNNGLALDYIVEADPQISADLMAYGFNVMHFMHAAYTRPDWRPDSRIEQAPWHELAEREMALRAMRKEDTRV